MISSLLYFKFFFDQDFFCRAQFFLRTVAQEPKQLIRLIGPYIIGLIITLDFTSLQLILAFFQNDDNYYIYIYIYIYISLFPLFQNLII